MKSPDASTDLAEAMVKIGKANGRAVSALITSMDAPLGFAIGNILELEEAIAVLKGGGPEDLTEICLALASEMARLSLSISEEEARRRARECLKSGLAYEKFKEWISAQGGDVSYAENPDKLAKAPCCREILARADGYVSKMDTEMIGLTSVSLGAGRVKKEDVIDPTAGIILRKKAGDAVCKGEVIATLYAADQSRLSVGALAFDDAVTISAEKPPRIPLIYKIIR
jgi:pyrimidine-nucleoside phosphorylase